MDYIKELRAAADLDYARALAAGEVTVLDGERAPGFAEVDTRYVYDAERLIEALESLWNERSDCAAHEILMDVERTGDKPDLPLWHK